jgi:Subtilase family
MNDVLQLRGTFNQKPSGGRPGLPNMPKSAKSVTAAHLHKLLKELQELDTYWQGEKLIPGALIDIHYIDVIAKSNRVSGYFNKGKRPNESVVGARFDSTNEKQPKHIITHYITSEVINDTIVKLQKSVELLDAVFDGKIGHNDIAYIKSKNIPFDTYGLSASAFLNIVVDSYYIENFGVPSYSPDINNRQIITIYQTGKDTSSILQDIGITVTPNKLLGEYGTTLLLQPDEIKLLQNRAPYLIAMAIQDLTKLSLEDIGDSENSDEHQKDDIKTIGSPDSEPTIGVIDTLFDERVYFNEWVDFRNMVDPEIPISQEDFRHGTAVSSIIVDGHSINPDLDDGCGNFKVRHFGVASGGTYSAFTITKLIQEIIAANPDIKVWNLSLGSVQEVNPNFISPEAAILDKIQFDNDVIFVVSGTNKPDKRKEDMLIGAPADSINSIVVNSVDKDGNPASYSRKGRVLSFFNKPDVSAMGGDGDKNEQRIRVCEPAGEAFVTGTSFAAPWIARKLAYLIEVLGLSREVAKALLVDAAADWDDTGNNQDLAPYIGHGAVPIKIEDIVKSKDDEIKFVMSGVSTEYDTYAYNIPVPISNDMHPFVTKATLSYFPQCSINQGVDYTNTELDVSIGRISPKGIKPINKNVQTVNGHYVYEGEARKLFRKWDNTKHIREKYGKSLRARQSYESGMWGVSVKTKERLEKRDGYGIKFGLVVTLKEVNGVNRVHDFMQKARLAGWIVSEVNVEARVALHEKLQETIRFD